MVGHKRRKILPQCVATHFKRFVPRGLKTGWLRGRGLLEERKRIEKFLLEGRYHSLFMEDKQFVNAGVHIHEPSINDCVLSNTDYRCLRRLACHSKWSLSQQFSPGVINSSAYRAVNCIACREVNRRWREMEVVHYKFRLGSLEGIRMCFDVNGTRI